MIVEETREPVYGQEVKTAGLFVLLGGLITTALACWVVYLGNTGGNSTGLLGVYILFIVPISAIIAGFAAGAGYSILSWLTGVRVSSRLLVVVFVLTLLSYFAIQYCEYRKMQPRRAGSNETVSFPAYFDAITRSYSYHLDAGISSRSETTNKRSKPVTGIGVLGYGFRMLEIIGYSLGGIVPLLLLRTKPYCARCQRYREYHKVITFPALHLSSTTSKKEI